VLAAGVKPATGVTFIKEQRKRAAQDFILHRKKSYRTRKIRGDLPQNGPKG
jgi:hypothetical protein